ncbi:MAG: FAD:protein FMN transferase [Lachnospiraceae bacterium]|nr:FAD:protein FMN transferase [Lachnospiraceae bacterium]
MKKKQNSFWMVLVAIVIVTIFIVSAVAENKRTDKTGEVTRDIFAMDTYMTLKVYGKESSKAIDEAVKEIERLDRMLNTEDKDSDISKLNSEKKMVMPKEMADMFSVSKDIYEKTEGAFDVSIYPLMQEWGFTTKEFAIPTEKRINELLKNVGMSKIKYDEKNGLIELKSDMKIDFGGIAKGYTSQHIIDILKKYDVSGGIISLGGNVQAFGEKPDSSSFKVGIQDPFNTDKYAGILAVNNKCVITSGDYQRFFEKDGVVYHHILNPDNGRPAAGGLKSVTVINEDGTVADALSTALFVMGVDKSVEFWKRYGQKYNFDIIMIDREKNIFITEGIEDIFESDYEYNLIK